jgi:hypothetical protein
MDKKNTVKMTIYISQETFQKLRKKGYLDDVKHTEIIRQAIDSYLTEHAKQLTTWRE